MRNVAELLAGTLLAALLAVADCRYLDASSTLGQAEETHVRGC